MRAAAELSGVDLPAGAAERPDGGAAAAGGPGEGAGAELPPAGRHHPAGRRAEEAQPQQTEPGERRKSRREGHADDLLHGACKTPHDPGMGVGQFSLTC